MFIDLTTFSITTCTSRELFQFLTLNGKSIFTISFVFLIDSSNCFSSNKTSFCFGTGFGFTCFGPINSDSFILAAASAASSTIIPFLFASSIICACSNFLLLYLATTPWLYCLNNPKPLAIICIPPVIPAPSNACFNLIIASESSSSVVKNWNTGFCNDG